MASSPRSFLIVSSNAYIPQLMAGSERSSQVIAAHLQQNGNSVSILCGLIPNGIVGFWNRIRRKVFRVNFPVDRIEGVKIYRAWTANGSIAHHLSQFTENNSFDLALVQAGYPFSVSRELNCLGIPSIVFLRDVQFQDSDGLPVSSGLVRYIANSEFTARQFLNRFGVMANAVIPPSVATNDYLVDRTPEYVLMINPIKEKGLELTLELARRRPDIPFLLQESWILSPGEKEKLITQLANYSNIKLSASRADMRPIYSRAKVLLVPSQLMEAWGRVVSEAHVSGIPVLASNIGGLPESVGPGGILLEPDNVDAWEKALAQVWDDPSYEAALSKQALEYAQRPDIQPQYLAKAIDEQIGQSLSNFGQ